MKVWGPLRGDPRSSLEHEAGHRTLYDPASLCFPSAPGPPVRLVFPEVRLTAVRIVWQPPEEPNGVILGKEHWGGRERFALSCFYQTMGWVEQIMPTAASPGHRASQASFVPEQGTEAFSRNEIYILLTQNSLHLFMVHGKPIRNHLLPLQAVPVVVWEMAG